MNVSGLNGELRVGYQTAAQLGRWTLEYDAGQGTFSANVTDVNGYWSTQPPFTLRLELNCKTWEWHNVTPVMLDNARVECVLTGRPHIKE